MLENNRISLEDSVYRSYGILKYARTLTVEELYRMLSDLRLGISLGLMKDVPVEALNHLLSVCGDATLQAEAGAAKNAMNINVKRADTVRAALA